MGYDMGEIKVQIYGSQSQRGPGKVVNNLILGLNKIGVWNSFNTQPIPNTKKICLSNHQILHTHIDELFIGPNICVLPIDDHIVMSQKYKKYLVNSDWTYNAYKRWIPENKLSIWPVGIDTDLFSDKSYFKKTNDCLIYFKRRDLSELNKVKEFLTKINQSFEVITYGNYNEDYFINCIEKSRYGIVIDNCESQGIAIQEMMSSNLPLFIWDVQYWNDRGDEFKIPSSSVPYWDNVCGLIETDHNKIFETFSVFLDNLNFYSPRNYILENLSLESQAINLLNIIK